MKERKKEKKHNKRKLISLLLINNNKKKLLRREGEREKIHKTLFHLKVCKQKYTLYIYNTFIFIRLGKTHTQNTN